MGLADPVAEPDPGPVPAPLLLLFALEELDELELLEAQASKALPRTDGSSTSSCKRSSTLPPPAICRLALTVTFHRLAAVFC